MHRVTKISEKVYFFKRQFPSSNTSLIKGDRVILVDPGYNPSGNIKSLNPLLKKADIRLQDIDCIWFTHNHPDHVQLTHYILQETDAEVASHPGAKEIVESEKPLEGLIKSEIGQMEMVLKKIYPDNKIKRKRIEKIARGIIKFYGKPLSIGIKPVKIDYFLEDGDKKYGINILNLPGHTPDELGFSINSVLITGDLLATFSMARPAVLNVPSSDIDDAIKSLKKIYKISPDYILPGHGNYTRISRGNLSTIYRQTRKLREFGFKKLEETHSFIPYALGIQKVLPLSVRLQERMALLPIIYKSYLKKRID